MVGKGHLYRVKSTEVSIDTDFNPYRKAMMQNSAIRSRVTAPRMDAELMLDCDVDRVIQYFQEQGKG